jgi:hypothetical protein
MMCESNDADILAQADFARAVVSINKRAERQTDYSKLVDIFVETDLPLRCETTDHQIVLGRRGTGKTHLLKYFQHRKQATGNVVYYADCTRLGSGLPSISSQPLVVASKYFSSLLNDLGTNLLDHTVRLERPVENTQERIWARLSEGLVAYMKPSDADISSVFNYRQISDTLRAVLEDLNIPRFYLIIDEWAQVPLAAQPYLAEFIKRAILTVPTVSIKILAVNYQCRFSDQLGGNTIGMQRTADITDVVDIDRYLIFDENQPLVTEFFGQLLYNHLGAELGWDLTAAKEQKIKKIKGLFTQEPAFIELVRSAEGNCRDFICILSKAYLEGYRRGGTSKAISIPHICAAASAWYSNEKESNIIAEKEIRETISFLLDKVLKGYKSRTFMVEAGCAEHPKLNRLLNERILHRLNMKYSHPDRPGLRYELFTLDYGAYVAYRGTVNEPREQLLFAEEELQCLSEDEKKGIVPFDDRRSIRRIVFDPDKLTLDAE